MKKKLNETEITNELRDASLYFQPNTKTRRRPANAQPEEPETTALPDDLAADDEPAESTEADGGGGFQPPEAPTQETPVDSEPAPQEEQTLAAQQPAAETAPGMDHAVLIETIRRAVKPVGKEATFCRITPDEKNTLADIVYAFKRHEFIPIRTSENEIIRIGLAWLVENYRSKGENSILTQVLLRLND